CEEWRVTLLYVDRSELVWYREPVRLLRLGGLRSGLGFRLLGGGRLGLARRPGVPREHLPERHLAVLVTLDAHLRLDQGDLRHTGVLRPGKVDAVETEALELRGRCLLPERRHRELLDPVAAARGRRELAVGDRHVVRRLAVERARELRRDREVRLVRLTPPR